jgi:hypothetical protein
VGGWGAALCLLQQCGEDSDSDDSSSSRSSSSSSSGGGGRATRTTAHDALHAIDSTHEVALINCLLAYRSRCLLIIVVARHDESQGR